MLRLGDQFFIEGDTDSLTRLRVIDNPFLDAIAIFSEDEPLNRKRLGERLALGCPIDNWWVCLTFPPVGKLEDQAGIRGNACQREQLPQNRALLVDLAWFSQGMTEGPVEEEQTRCLDRDGQFLD